jgi:hypothetical protein
MNALWRVVAERPLNGGGRTATDSWSGGLKPTAPQDDARQRALSLSST